MSVWINFANFIFFLAFVVEEYEINRTWRFNFSRHLRIVCSWSAQHNTQKEQDTGCCSIDYYKALCANIYEKRRLTQWGKWNAMMILIGLSYLASGSFFLSFFAITVGTIMSTKPSTIMMMPQIKRIMLMPAKATSSTKSSRWIFITWKINVNFLSETIYFLINEIIFIFSIFCILTTFGD